MKLTKAQKRFVDSTPHDGWPDDHTILDGSTRAMIERLLNVGVLVERQFHSSGDGTRFMRPDQPIPRGFIINEELQALTDERRRRRDPTWGASHPMRAPATRAR